MLQLVLLLDQHAIVELFDLRLVVKDLLRVFAHYIADLRDAVTVIPRNHVNVAHHLQLWLWRRLWDLQRLNSDVRVRTEPLWHRYVGAGAEPLNSGGRCGAEARPLGGSRSRGRRNHAVSPGNRNQVVRQLNWQGHILLIEADQVDRNYELALGEVSFLPDVANSPQLAEDVLGQAAFDQDVSGVFPLHDLLPFGVDGLEVVFILEELVWRDIVCGECVPLENGKRSVDV